MKTKKYKTASHKRMYGIEVECKATSRKLMWRYHLRWYIYYNRRVHHPFPMRWLVCVSWNRLR